MAHRNLRFLHENLFVGVWYNTAEGELAGMTGDVGAKRWQIGAGWFSLPGSRGQTR